MKFKPGDKVTLIGPNTSRHVFTVHHIGSGYVPPRPCYYFYPLDHYLNRDFVCYLADTIDQPGPNYEWKLVEEPAIIMKDIL